MASDVVISCEYRWPSVLRGGILAELEVVMAVVLPCNVPALGAVCLAVIGTLYCVPGCQDTATWLSKQLWSQASPVQWSQASPVQWRQASHVEWS